jgi:hypothetical protein
MLGDLLTGLADVYKTTTLALGCPGAGLFGVLV